jgi:hypothetical protein
LDSCKFDRTGTGNAAPPPPTVTVASSDLSQVIEWETATARVEAIEAVEVRPRVSGHITEVHFAAGEIVHKGDVLFVIDRRWYWSELNRTTAEVARGGIAWRRSRNATCDGYRGLFRNDRGHAPRIVSNAYFLRDRVKARSSLSQIGTLTVRVLGETPLSSANARKVCQPPNARHIQLRSLSLS